MQMKLISIETSTQWIKLWSPKSHHVKMLVPKVII